MEASVQSVPGAAAPRANLNDLVAKETWTIEDHKEILRLLFTTRDAAEKFKAIAAEMEREAPQPKGLSALKIGIARYMLCRFPAALEVLADATDNKERRYFQGLCYRSLGLYEKGIEEFQRAADRGLDATEANLAVIELQALGGQVPAAEKALGKSAGKLDDNATYWYLRGLTDELGGRGDQAVESYTKARSLDSSHPGATFRLAYYRDLHGEEERAVELYKQCLSHPPVHANVLLNLAVLHEDAGRYEQAARCLQRILATNPNHARARLFLKDVRASTSMYYDEDQAKRIARRNAVLDIPVTDFELSVRARNCLKKMNIMTLGDLVRTSEASLLSYKNFGETSLKEIKDMLTAKALRLGQAMEEAGEFALPRPAPPVSVGNEGVLGTPVEQIEFSVRCRRALETLKVRTLGELAAKTEAELLACKNFGQTSLNEVKQRLAEYGLKLREVE
jgi:DNA-directed RNA polymerase subunit alpha